MPHLQSSGRQTLLFQINLVPDAPQGESSWANSHLAAPMPVAAAASYSATLNVTVPDADGSAGHELIVRTNRYGQQPELDVSSNGLAPPIRIHDPPILSNSTLRLHPGKDDLVIDALRQGPGAGESVAVRNSFLSGNRGDDVITLVADVWGERALVFGGPGNHTITCHGLGRDSFIQAGLGDDTVSIGRLENTPGAAWLQRPDGGKVRPSTVRGGDGFDVLQLREVLQGDFEAQAVWFSEPGEQGWLFQGARFSGFESITFGSVI